MSSLDPLLKSYAPPPVPEGLAARAAAAAAGQPQAPAKASRSARRHDRRRGWRAHPFLAGGAAVCLAFTSAVAATYASGGRIEIPGVREMIAAVPGIPQPNRAEVKHAARAAPANAHPRVAPQPETPPVAEAQQMHLRPLPPRVRARLAQAEQITRARRAAGLPTPRADRIEATAQRIVERREAKGLPVPPVEEVEGRLALRQMRRMQMIRSLRAQGYAVSPQQIERLIERLPPDKRARFERLPLAMQRGLIRRRLQRIRQRSAAAGEGFAVPPG